MEPTLTTPPPVPLPPIGASTVKDFRKSKFILVLAYIQLGLFVFSLISNMARVHLPFLSISPSIIFLIPSLLVVFTKSKGVYKVARILLIIEYLLIPLFIIGFLFLLSSMHW
ncbi:MAG: hypothetical protein AAB477_01745 [Patescibacteria group bacterium]